MIDPYTQAPGHTAAPPTTWTQRLRHLGPSVIISGSIVGSGEILLTSSLGAEAGFILLWWVLVSCWSKSIVQAELGRYILTSGDTYLRAVNRLPGKLPGPKGPVGWPIWLGLIAFFPGVLGLGGIIGGAAQALSLLIDGLPSTVAAAIIAGVVMIILGTGSYVRLERVMLFLVIGFTVTTLCCAVLMQSTEYAMTAEDIASGFTFSFPVEYAILALAMYGYTGVNSGEIAAYTYWCVEKGYPRFIGGDHDDPQWLERAQGWIKVLQTDVWATLLILTAATLPFYALGAGVLNRMDLHPEGLETISVLSSMFTVTLGGWAVWVFGIGAFFILMSTALSGIGAGGRFIPDYLIELGFLDRNKVNRLAWIRGYVLIIPVIGFLLYLGFQRPVLLVTISAVVAAMMLPVQSAATLWLQSHRMDPRVRPKAGIRLALWSVFSFQFMMACAVIWFVVL
ncbi:MAG: Nramp family divalent metal transporter [Gammaproteobacteria bacterium]|nr:Nramp family divalent metal transporter [Gammaproteobacteria bacterium]